MLHSPEVPQSASCGWSALRSSANGNSRSGGTGSLPCAWWEEEGEEEWEDGWREGWGRIRVGCVRVHNVTVVVIGVLNPDASLNITLTTFPDTNTSPKN